MSGAPSFTEWFGSPANPLGRASELVQHYTADALKAAFEAGEARAKYLAKRERRGDDIENPFT